MIDILLTLLLVALAPLLLVAYALLALIVVLDNLMLGVRPLYSLRP